jgi:ring-1,2-phenylacetyl-CoA epoxidase subunit PaaC
VEQNLITALTDLLTRLADDKLILGHRNSEWTGMGPVLEEDIAFASMAQDEIGHALSYYRILNEHCGVPDPDTYAFSRTEFEFRSCHLVEQPIGDYAFSLVRHFLFEMADMVRLRSLAQGPFLPLSDLARRIGSEEKYHQMHAKIWLKQLAHGSEEARLRLQTALNTAYPMALALFEATEHDALIAEVGVQAREAELQQHWLEVIEPLIAQAGLQLPNAADATAFMGGRKGYHSEYLQPLLDEMQVVFRIDPVAKW